MSDLREAIDEIAYNWVRDHIPPHGLGRTSVRGRAEMALTLARIIEDAVYPFTLPGPEEERPVDRNLEANLF